MGATRPQQWAIDGQTYDIQSTYWMVVDGELMFVVEWNLPPTIPRPEDEPSAMTLARPLMDHALDEGLHRRMTVSGSDGPMEPVFMGVVLQETSATGTSGYRVRERIDVLRPAADED